MRETSGGAPPSSFEGPGSVVLSRPAKDRPLPIDLPFVPEAEVFFDELLEAMDRSGGIPRLLFAAGGGSGKDAALAAVGLARRAAARGMDVLLVDASFESPLLGKPFPYQPEEGLADMVLWGASLHAAIHKTRDERIRVVNVGSPPPEPERFWDSAEADETLRAMRAEAELTILVGPFRGDGGDSPLLTKCDRVLLVRRAAGGDSVRPEEIDAARAIEIVLEEEAAAGTGERPVPPEAEGRSEGTRIPVWRTIGAFAVLCIVIGFVLSYFYLNRRTGGVEDVRVAERISPAEERAEGEGAPASGAPEGGLEEQEPEAARAAGGAGGEEERAPGEEKAPPPAARDEAAAGSETPSGEAPEERPALSTARDETPPARAASARERRVSGPAFGVHVESFPTREDAEEAAARFLDAGETVTVVEKAIPGKGTWHRIVLGRFAGAEEARAHADKAKTRFGLDYVLVVRLEG